MDNTIEGSVSAHISLKMATTSGYAPREGWRYVVLMSKFFHQFLHQGFLKSFGVLIPSMVIQLKCSYSVAGFLSSLFFTSTFVFCPLARHLSMNYGCRTISLAGGSLIGTSVSCMFFAPKPAFVGLLLLIAGIGNSFLSQTAYVVLREHFDKQFGSANAVASLGYSVGSLTMPLLSNLLLQAYGLWGTFLILGGLMANCIPVGATFRYPRCQYGGRAGTQTQSSNDEADGPSVPFIEENKQLEACDGQDEKDTLPTSETKSIRGYTCIDEKTEETEAATDQRKDKDRSRESPSGCSVAVRYIKSVLFLIATTFALDDLWKEREFAFFVIPCQMFVEIIFTGWSLFVVSYGLSEGIDSAIAPFLLVSGVIGGIFSRVMSILLLRDRPARALNLYAFFFITLIGGLFLFLICSEFVYLIFCSTLTGFGVFGLYTTYYAVLNVSVSEDHFSGVLAASFFTTGIMMSLSSLITGRLYDATQSLKTVFTLYGVLGCIAAILMLTFIYRRRSRTSPL